ncbi:MAG: MBL fold metallo-hydrolase [Candidatus Bathyarchaeota archaeon]|nr:MBL fold metallo-hydrolase [Candidatus Bathyarchaeota archaeon]MDH5786870.1 MBL fold metallo-hydrolase [Candidatus Bathyarchaeota archaeon]
MIVNTFTVGRFFTNCYVVGCEQTKEATVIDPGFENRYEAEKIFRFVDDNSLTPKFVLNTHGHPDHTCGNRTMKEKFKSLILIHEYDAHILESSSNEITELFGFEKFSIQPDILLHDGELVKFGKTTLKVMLTSGHSQGSISFVGDKEVFTGDTLFLGSVGRTDFPESSAESMKLSLRKLANLADYLIVYPGHGPTTAIGKEKASNPFLQWL